jgi:hypothetical protein
VSQRHHKLRAGRLNATTEVAAMPARESILSNKNNLSLIRLLLLRHESAVKFLD